MNNPPIIFCHYGNSNYLELTLFTAKTSNPHKNIYLLGDSSNLNIAKKAGVIHVDFIQFNHTKSILEFNNNFKFIAGSKHGRKDWTKFVFLRWFYINEFIIQRHIDSFWHFDSDNFILSDLSIKEEVFKQYDNTEQCGGICLNGFITSKNTIQMYTRHMLHLFNNEYFLNLQRDKCSLDDSLAFTEMASYNDFKKKYNLNSIRLSSLHLGDTFDDCLAFADGMEQTKELFNNYNLKELYLNRNNDVYFKLNSSNKFIKVNSINLSWLPFSIILRIFYLTLRKKVFLLKYLNLPRKDEYIKVNFRNYSSLDKILDKLLFKIFYL